MKLARAILFFSFLSLSPLTAPAQDSDKAPLEKLLNQMDAAAANFHTTEASFVWDQYQKVVNETDSQKGKVYFRRQSKEIQMVADIAEPEKKYVLYADGKVQVYEPKIDQVTVYNPGKKSADFEAFLVLGFGGGGHDMLKSFDVKYLGKENVNGTETAKIELTPKSARVRNSVDRILLWIDPARGMSLQQQMMDPSGDFRLAKYSDIQLNGKIADNVFKLKTTSKTRVVSPQG